MRKKQVEPGAASIKIKLSKGNIIVYHGTDKTILEKIENAEEGSWDKIWKTIRNLKSVE